MFSVTRHSRYLIGVLEDPGIVKILPESRLLSFSYKNQRSKSSSVDLHIGFLKSKVFTL